MEADVSCFETCLLLVFQAPIKPIKRVLTTCRELGYHVMHTREGHRPDLADLPANKVKHHSLHQVPLNSTSLCSEMAVRTNRSWYWFGGPCWENFGRINMDFWFQGLRQVCVQCYFSLKVRGEKGWDIIPELYPIEGEPIIEKPGKVRI